MTIVEFLAGRFAEEDRRIIRLKLDVLMKYEGVKDLAAVCPSVRELAAKREIVDVHKLVLAEDVWGEPTGGLGCSICDVVPDLTLGGLDIVGSNGCETLKSIARIYSDHPDFNPDWTT